MRNGIFPIFAKGRVLKKESIEYLRDFPNDLVSLAHAEYSDGVIFGFSISYADGQVLVSKGALKFRGEIIVLDENSIPIPEFEQQLFIKLHIGKIRETEDYIACPIEMIMNRIKPLQDSEIELGRFYLNPGAILRCKHDSFRDLHTPENTLDITNVPYAGIGSATMHPIALREYARSLLFESSDAADIAFALMCLNGGVVQKSCIQWHIAKKSNKQYSEYTLATIYDKLSEMLSARRGKPAKPRFIGIE